MTTTFTIMVKALVLDFSEQNTKKTAIIIIIGLDGFYLVLVQNTVNF